jgi:hypothetical protein
MSEMARGLIMKRFPSSSLILLAVSTLSFAQAQQSGGWRRFDQTAAQPDQAPPVAPDQDPTQPVARVDEYGQPPALPPDQQQRVDRPLAVPYGLPPQVTVPAGTFVTVRMNQTLASNRNQPGDVFTAVLEQPLVVNGIVVAQRGQTVIGHVVDSGKDGRVTRLGLEITGITLADGTQLNNIQSQMVLRRGHTNTGRDVATVATTTAVGAAIGGIADYGRGAAIGAGAGAAAGLLGVLLTPGSPTVVYAESTMSFQIQNPIAVNIARAPQAFRYVGPNEYDQPVQAQVARRPPPRAPYYSGPYVSPYPYAYPYPYYGYPYGVGVGVVVVRGGRFGRRW